MKQWSRYLGHVRCVNLKLHNFASVDLTKPTNTMLPSLGGLEPPTFRLTAEGANQLRHRDTIYCDVLSKIPNAPYATLLVQKNICSN